MHRTSDAKRLASTGLGLALLIAAVPARAQDGSAATPQAAPDQPGATAGSINDGDIIVTARKGAAERLEDVPISIAAVTGERLERLGIRTASEYLASVPSVGQFEISPGQTRIQIRGVVASYGEPTVGYYLDEIPFSNLIEPIVPDASGFDLERIEVLRGPQGTLYGAGSSGGVVRILTAQPDLDHIQAKGDFSLSSTRHADDPNFDVNGAFNLPLIPGKLALRLTGSYRSLSGVLTNPVIGRRNYDDQTAETYRARLRGELSERLDVTAGVWVQRLRNFTGDGSISPTLSRTTILEPQSVDYTIYSGIGNYRGDGFTVTSASSYLTYDTVRERAIASIIPFTYSFDSKLFTQEVRAVSDREGAFAWAVGGFLRTGHTNNRVFLPAFNLDDRGRFETTSWAVFGEGTLFFAGHRGEFTVGGRYFRDRRREGFNGKLIANTFPAFSPKVNLTWHLNDDSIVYLNFARGFRSGINQSSPVIAFAAAANITVPLSAPPESTWSYEAGFKGSFLDDAVSVELAGFLNKIRNIQSLVQLPQIPGLSAIVGGNRATVPGVEGTLSLRPAPGISLSGSLSYNDGRYDTNAFNAFRIDDPISGASRWTTSGTFDIERPLSGVVNSFANLFVSHFSPRFTPNITPAVGVPAQAITNARAKIGVRSGPVEASVFAENLLNENGRISATFLADGRNQFLRPRTIGVNLRMNLEQPR